MTPKREEYQIFPTGHDNDPEEERYPLGTLDYLSACTYNNYAVFFKLNDEDKPQVAKVLKEGLERTLAQTRHLVGKIEKDDEKGRSHSYVKRKDSSVQFNVQWLDSAQEAFPSYEALEKAEFASSSLGDFAVLSVDGFTYGEQPACNPNAEPVIAAYQANFIPGGMILNTHHHHYSNDIMGWASFIHQLADNCRSIVNQSAPPSWDMGCEDHSRFVGPKVAEESKVDGPTAPDRNPDLHDFTSLLFHLPKSKAEELKKAAMPTDGSWISTYDAFSAYLWRMMTKHRAALYKSDLTKAPLWGEAVNMRTRLNPPVPERIQGNIFVVNLTKDRPVPLTTAEIISEAPLSRVASEVRALTNGATQELLNAALEMLAPIRDKTTLFIRINTFAPLTIIMTDWRDSKICEADFGFGRPKAFRHLFSNTVTEGLAIVYPPRDKGPDTDEGNEFVVTLEKDLVEALTEDPEMKKYFEFRGFEVEYSKPAVNGDALKAS